MQQRITHVLGVPACCVAFIICQLPAADPVLRPPPACPSVQQSERFLAESLRRVEAQRRSLEVELERRNQLVRDLSGIPRKQVCACSTLRAAPVSCCLFPCIFHQACIFTPGLCLFTRQPRVAPTRVQQVPDVLVRCILLYPVAEAPECGCSYDGGARPGGHAPAADLNHRGTNRWDTYSLHAGGGAWPELVPQPPWRRKQRVACCIGSRRGPSPVCPRQAPRLCRSLGVPKLSSGCGGGRDGEVQAA